MQRFISPSALSPESSPVITLAAAALPKNLPEAIASTSDNPKRSPLRRNRPLVISGLIGLAAFVGSVGKLSLDSSIGRHAETWGVPQDPKFRPLTISESNSSSPNQIGDYKSYSARLIEARMRHSSFLNLLLEGESLLAELNRINNSSEEYSTDFSAKLLSFLDNTKRFDPSAVGSGNINTPTQLSDSEFEARLGSVESYARTLFEETTGKPLPANVKITHAPELPDSIGGRAYEFRCEVIYSGTSYASKLASIMHELGHLAAPIAEQDGGLSILGTQFRSDIVNMREEACAELFRLAATARIQMPELRDSMPLIDDWAISQYLAGHDTSVHFNLACLVADAAVEHFDQDFDKAFLELCRSPNIPTEIQDRVESIERLSGEGLSLTKSQEEGSASINRLRELRKSVLAASQRDAAQPIFSAR